MRWRALAASVTLSWASALTASEPPLARVWIDSGTVHVRFSGNDTPGRFAGKVCSRAPLHELATFALSGADSVQLAARDRCIFLKIDATSGQRGFSFALPQSTVIFDLMHNRRQLPAARVGLGLSAESSPDSSPFSIPGAK